MSSDSVQTPNNINHHVRAHLSITVTDPYNKHRYLITSGLILNKLIFLTCLRINPSITPAPAHVAMTTHVKTLCGTGRSFRLSGRGHLELSKCDDSDE